MPSNQANAHALDLDAGERALKQLEPTLRAMSAQELGPINFDPQEGAMSALALVDIAREPTRLARLRQLPAAIFPGDTIDQLELNAWALWFTHVKLQTESAQATSAKVDAETYEASGKHLTKMLKLIEYHVGEVPSVATELADIKSGIGYQDRASDLVRAAILFDTHRRELEKDARYYHADDSKIARRHAETILDSIRASLGKSAAEWNDLRTRAYSRMAQLYNELKLAGEFVFRAEPEQRDLFTALRQAVVTRRARPKANGDTQAAPEQPLPGPGLSDN